MAIHTDGMEHIAGHDQAVIGRHDRYSPALPPLEAWREPEKWLNLENGFPKEGVQLLQTPVDERGFVKVDEMMDILNTEIFYNDYVWKRDPANRETRTDDHHFYFTDEEYSRAAHSGNEIPHLFRELPINIGRMHRQRHNTIHALFEKRPMPTMDAMYDRIREYNIAHAAFKRLYVTANETVSLMGSFSRRREDVALGRIVPKEEDDRIVEAYLKRNFSRYFGRYMEAVDIFRETENKEIFYKDHDKIKITRPAVVARKFGSIVKRSVVMVEQNEQAA